MFHSFLNTIQSNILQLLLQNTRNDWNTSKAWVRNGFNIFSDVCEDSNRKTLRFKVRTVHELQWQFVKQYDNIDHLILEFADTFSNFYEILRQNDFPKEKIWYK